MEQKWFAEQVGKRTGGRVVVETYVGGELYKHAQIVDAVTTGAVDIGFVPCAWFTTRNPVFGLNDYFFLYTSFEHFQRIADELDKILKPLFEAQNAKFLHWFNYGDMACASNKPIVKPTDAKGVLIRAPNTTVVEMVKAVGGVPAAIAPEEVYDALGKGTIGAAYSGWSTFYSRKWYEVSRNFSGPVGLNPWTCFMNLSTWNSLPRDIQQTIMEVAKETAQLSAKEGVDFDKKSIDFLKGKGTVTIFSAEQVAAWQEALRPIYDKWIADCEKAGFGSQARQILKICKPT